jgi:DNA topoisomerase VI subunit A
LTAKGMPDMATRSFLHALCTALPHLHPVAGCTACLALTHVVLRINLVL